MPLKEAPLDIVDGVDRTLDLVMRPANTNVSSRPRASRSRRISSRPAHRASTPRPAELDAVAD